MHEEEGEEVQCLPCDLLRPQAPHRQVPVLQVRVTGGRQRSEEVSRGQQRSEEVNNGQYLALT